MKLRFQIYVEEHEIAHRNHQQGHVMLNENTCKSHISLTALWCKYEDFVRDKRREILKTYGKHHKCRVKFGDICKFITSENLSIYVHHQSVQRLGIPVVSNRKIIRFWQTLVIFFVVRKLHDKRKKTFIAFRLSTCF